MNDELWHATGRSDLIGTRDERAALFDHLVEATLNRQAISPAKNEIFGIDVAEDMGRYRDALIDAQTPSQLWYALNLISNTRHDRHLQVQPVEGGLPVPASFTTRQLRNYANLDACQAQRVPVELASDFSQETPFIFLAGIASDFSTPGGLAIGARLLAVNGEAVADYVRRIEPYHCYSTPTFFWYHLPKHIVRQGSELPTHDDRLKLTFAGPNGAIDLDLDYREPKNIRLPAQQRFAGWALLTERESFRLYESAHRKTIALEWLGFGTSLCADVDTLMDYCAAASLLDHALVFDASQCRGGDYGGYLLQVLAKERFRINFGDLRRCDLIPSIVEEVLAEDGAAIASGRLNSGQIQATEWRKDWLTDEVLSTLDLAGSTIPVPFKCAHQPKDGDGWLDPAPIHFTGPMVMITMPFGGSHIDQVAAQISDNRMCVAHIGMPLGGFSKTWVGTEILTLPSGRPLVGFEWSCGNTIRPNGEILESNPAIPDVPLPQTSHNYHRHHAVMLERACEILAKTHP